MMLSSPPGRWIIKSNKIVPLDGTSKDIAVDTNVFYVDRTNGRIGIGTTGPGARLTVKDAGAGLVQVGQLSDVQAYGAVGFASTLTSSNYVLAQQTTGDLLINTNAASNIRFRVGNTDKMIMDSNGNVGIGTTGPGQALETVGKIKSRKQVTGDTTGVMIGSTAQDRPVITFHVSDDTTRGKIEINDVNAAAGDRLQFTVFQGGGTGLVDVMSLRGSGNVGIGTTGPANLLDIARKLAITSTGHILASKDTAGTVTITAGNTTATVTYDNTYSVSPYVQLTPTTNLGTLANGSQWWVNSSTGSFVANIAPVGDAATFNYFVIGSMV